MSTEPVAHLLHRVTPTPPWRHVARLSVMAWSMQFAGKVAFRASFVADLASSLLLAAAQVVFWVVVVGRDGTVAGWTFSGIMIFMAYAELFWAIQRGFFFISTRFHEWINQGRLDAHLCRPVDPRIAALLLHMQPVFFIRSLPSAAAYFALGATAGGGVAVVPALEGLLLLLLATLIYTEFTLTATYLAFWWGQSNGLNPVMSGLWEVMRYPTDIFDRAIRSLFTWMVPTIFAATWPAYVCLGKPTPGGFWGTLAITCGLLAAWHGIQTVVWRRGLRRYESCGG